MENSLTLLFYVNSVLKITLVIRWFFYCSVLHHVTTLNWFTLSFTIFILIFFNFKSGTIRRRFNKPAAAVRARMAQKCKDERRFGRLNTGPGSSPGDGNLEVGSFSPVAAVTTKNGPRKSRKRPANQTNSQNHNKHLKSHNSSLDISSTPIYQPAGSNDDGCSSATDSNQLPPISLSPIGDPDLDDCNSISHSISGYQSLYSLESAQPQSTLPMLGSTNLSTSEYRFSGSSISCTNNITLSANSPEHLSSG